MTRTAIIAGTVLMGLVLMGHGSAPAQEGQLAYAVVSEVPKDKTRISAKIAIEGTVTDTKLLASEAITGNLIWKKLEICHAMRLEGQRSSEGFRVTTVRVVDGSMLPMALQGFAGDCLLKKALEIAPLVD
ncbi:hypothetical protein [Nitrospira lenta]|uniref:Uncharacterized protein n=1 Tax=Nitrospira lenta TaxID=1436998 RepID=A0A330L8H0_9BACT|nr:hypothetical protein [Nitrospira lenta]SPP66240.1 conserved exported hypothetical protein [Nitrospira lenta]